MEKGRAKENAKRLNWQYKKGDLVLIRHDMDGQPRGKMMKPTSGPYEVMSVKNSTIEINRGTFSEKINIRRLQPYHARA